MNRLPQAVRHLLMGGLAFLVFSGSYLTAQQEQPAAQPAEDRYAVPAGDDVDALVQFLNRVAEFRPQSQEEAIAHSQKALPALEQASARVLELEKDETSAAYRTARRIQLQIRAMKLPELDEKGREALLDEVTAFLGGKADLPLEDLGVAVQTAQMLEQLDSPLAGKAYETFGTILAKHENEGVAEFGNTMLGSAKRLNLVGSSMKIEGSTVDGQAFDLASLKGKVVLVDFWATWCGPCRAEFPNIMTAYDRYSDKGFEVVGISLDQDREALDQYLAEKEVPWITLHENEGQHSAAIEYGVNAIPFMVLIDREGKVVSTQARGEELNRLLAEQFAEQK
jgi:thiol-disulfide isomerase/thioredoxin